jgi:hypothetical protein
MASFTNNDDKKSLAEATDSFFQDFIVKNLDTGESFHIDKVEDYLANTQAKLSMLIPKDSKSGWSIAIPECNEFKDEKKTFTAYRIFVTNPNMQNVDMKTYSIYRRYSEFDDLVKKLKQNRWHNADKMGELPPKSWFGSMNSKAIKERQEALENFLNTLLYYIDPATCRELDDFFCPNLSVSTSLLSPDDKKSMLDPESIRFMTLQEGAERFGMLLEPSILKKQEEIRTRSLNKEGNGMRTIAKKKVTASIFDDDL